MSVSYQLLSAMGISYWIPRFNPSSLLVSDKPLFCAACLVLLPEKRGTLSIEQNQILNGMCKVLELNEDEWCVASVNDQVKSDEFDLIGREIEKWAPYSVLIMGEAFAKRLSLLEISAMIQVTYHPAELQKEKEHKRKAYEDLLRLKDHLSLVRAS